MTGNDCDTHSDAGRPPEDSDRFAVYRAAHHDIWWAKTQQWRVANWALVLTAAVVGIARTIHGSQRIPLESQSLYVLLLIVIAISAAWYLRRLHQDIVYSRLICRKIEKDTGIARVHEEIPRRDGVPPFHKRGLEFVYVMIAAIGFGVGVAVYILSRNLWVALAVGLPTLLIILVMVHGAKRAV